MKRLSPELQVATIGIAAIGLLETYALYQKVDGVMFGAAMAGIGAVVGWVFKGAVRHEGEGDPPRGS